MTTQAATPRRHGRSKHHAPPIPAMDEATSAAAEPAAATPAFLDPDTRSEMVARAAYFRAERRGFAEGCALQDWLEAEAEIDAMFGR